MTDDDDPHDFAAIYTRLLAEQEKEQDPRRRAALEAFTLETLRGAFGMGDHPWLDTDVALIRRRSAILPDLDEDTARWDAFWAARNAEDT